MKRAHTTRRRTFSAPSSSKGRSVDDTKRERPPRTARIGLSTWVAGLRGAGWEAPVGLAISSAGLVAPILMRLSLPGAQSDIPVHASLARGMVENGGWLSYTVWYPLLHFGSGGSTDPAMLRVVSVGLLVAAVALRSLIVFYASWSFTRNRTASIAISLLMLVAKPLINPWDPQDIYLGQVTPNVWHNSTQIFALPFAVLAFLAGAALLREPRLRTAGTFAGMAVLATLAKPSFLISLLPALGVMLLVTMWRARLAAPRQLAVIAVAFLPVTALLATQFLLVFGENGVRGTSLVLAPFAVWNAFSTNIGVSLVLSLAGPAVATLALTKRLRRDPMIVLSWFTLALAVCQIALLAERFASGEISFEGNFFWGSYSAVFMVFLAVVINLARSRREVASDHLQTREGLTTLLRTIAWPLAYVLLCVHAASGLYYLGRAGVGGFKVWT